MGSKNPFFPGQVTWEEDQGSTFQTAARGLGGEKELIMLGTSYWKSIAEI